MELHVRVSFLLLGLALLADTAVRADHNSTLSAAAAETTAPTTTTPKSTTTTTTPTMPEQHETNRTETPSSTPSANEGGNATTNETGSQPTNVPSGQTSPADNSTGTSTTIIPDTSTTTNVENTTKEETVPSSTTLSTAAGPTSSGKTENASSSSTSATPASVPSSTSTTVKHTSTSPSTNPTNVSAPTSTSTPSNTTTGTTTTTASTTPPTSSILISETNLLLANNSFFVELKGAANASLNNLTLAVFDANTTEVACNITYNSTTALNITPLLYVQHIDETLVQNLVSVAVVLYQPKSYMGKFTNTGLQDYVVFSLRPNAIAKNITETLLNGTAATIVRKGLTASNSTLLSLSRCTDVPRDSSVFFVTRQSRSKANTCPLIRVSRQLTLQLHLKAKNCMPSADDTDSIKQKLQMKLISEINQRCRCGLSTRQINSSLTCARDLYLEFRVHPSFHGQAEKFTTAFKSYVQNPNNTQHFGDKYEVVSCWQDCRKNGPHHPPGSKKINNGNISVTVAVVLSCIAVFLLILVAVIIYMRRKRNGIMRQFRMTRLQEDDDMDDMDDFIGGGLEQEPSFNSSQNNLTS